MVVLAKGAEGPEVEVGLEGLVGLDLEATLTQASWKLLEELAVDTDVACVVVDLVGMSAVDVLLGDSPKRVNGREVGQGCFPTVRSEWLVSLSSMVGLVA
jgi:hypothetical protein